MILMMQRKTLPTLLMALILFAPVIFAGNLRVYLEGGSAENLYQTLESYTELTDMRKSAMSDEELSLNVILSERMKPSAVQFQTILNKMYSDATVKDIISISSALVCIHTLQKTHHCVIKENLNPFEKRAIFTAFKKGAGMPLSRFKYFHPKQKDQYAHKIADITGYTFELIDGRQFCTTESMHGDSVISQYHLEIAGDAPCRRP